MSTIVSHFTKFKAPEYHSTVAKYRTQYSHLLRTTIPAHPQTLTITRRSTHPYVAYSNLGTMLPPVALDLTIELVRIGGSPYPAADITKHSAHSPLVNITESDYALP